MIDYNSKIANIKYLTQKEIKDLIEQYGFKETGIVLTQFFLAINDLEITKGNVCQYYRNAELEYYLTIRFDMAEMFKIMDDTNQNKYKRYPFLRTAGIYGIWDKREELIYIGQSRDIYERWKQHYRNTINFKKVSEKGDLKYKYFKEHYKDISFGVIEFVDDAEKLKWLEGFWINKYMPKFNIETVSLQHKRKRNIN